jgi:hypothetical protein
MFYFHDETLRRECAMKKSRRIENQPDPWLGYGSKT